MTHTALAPVQQFSMWSYTHMLPSLFLWEHLLVSIVALVTSVCLRGASLCKQNLESHKGPLHNSITRHRALLHSTHVNDRPSFLALSLGWFKCILGLHCVLTRRNTFSATSDLSVYTESKNVWWHTITAIQKISEDHTLFLKYKSSNIFCVENSKCDINKITLLHYGFICPCIKATTNY